MNSRLFSSIRNFFTGILSTIVGIIVPFIARTFIIYYMGEEYLGVNSLFTSIFTVINFANLGFSTAIAAFLYKPLFEKDTVKVNSLLNLLNKINHTIGLIVFAFGAFSFFNLNIFVTTDVPPGVNIHLLFVIFMADTLMSYYFKSYVHILLNALQRADVWNLSNTISRIFFGVLQILSICFIKKIEVYVLFTNLVTICNRLYCCYFAKTHFPQYYCFGEVDRQIKIKVFKDSLAMGLQKIGNMLSVSLDNIVIARYLDLVTVARYGNYNYILQALGMVIHTLNMSIMGSVGFGVIANKNEDSYAEFWLVNTVYLTIISVFSVLYFTCVQNFIYIWVGDKILPCLCILLFTLTFFFSQSKNVISLFKDVNGIWWKDRYRPLVGGIINLFLNIGLVKIIGLPGVIFSTLFSIVFIELPWEVHALFGVERKNYTKAYFFYLFKYLTIVILSIIISTLVTRHLAFSFFGLIFRFFISLTVIVIVLLLFNVGDNNFKLLIEIVIQKL